MDDQLPRHKLWLDSSKADHKWLSTLPSFFALPNKSIHTKVCNTEYGNPHIFRLQFRILLPDIYQNIGYEKIFLKNDYQRIGYGRLSGEYSVSL